MVSGRKMLVYRLERVELNTEVEQIGLYCLGVRPFPLLLLDEKDQAEGPTQAPGAVDSTPRLAIKDVDVGELM